jgi:hypothetical protein
MTDPIDPKYAIVSLMKGVVPERTGEIDAMWEKYDPEVRIMPDAVGIKLEADGDYIGFSLKTMDVFWLIGFSAWKAIECYSPLVILSAKFGGAIADGLRVDEQLPEIERDYKERLRVAKAIVESREPDSVVWPPDVPAPTDDSSKLADDRARAAFDLTCMASAFTYLHEFRHVMLDQDEMRPVREEFERDGTLPKYNSPEEEMQCDVWAREFMTVKLAAYARERGHDYHEVLRKRAMGLAVAALILHEITADAQYHGGDTYFPLVERLRALVGATPLPPDDDFWVFMASLLIGIFRQQHRPIDAPASSAADLVTCLLSQMTITDL